MRKELTPLERSIFEYMVDYLRRNTYQPSIREIGREFGIKSTKTVAEHLQSLADKGWVERDPSRSRGVKLVGAEVYPSFLTVPCYDRLADQGDPFAPDASTAQYRLDPALAGCDDAVFLRMSDDSLDGDGIRENDLLLVERVDATKVKSGDLVVCRAGGRGAVKHLRRNGGGTQLSASKPGIEPVTLGPSDELLVFGRVVGVFRQFHGNGNRPLEQVRVAAPVAG